MCASTGSMLNAESMSKSQKKKAKRKQKCVVCSTKLIKSDDDDYQYPIADNALSCSRDHQICIDCVKDLLYPTYKKDALSVGLAYSCPACNCHASIAVLHNLVLVKSSWKKVYGMFENKDHMFGYMGQIATFRNDEDDETETENVQISLSNLHLNASTSINDDSVSAATESQCIVCMSAERSHAMIPCGHKCLCINCATDKVFNECPMCRASVQCIYEIYE